MTDYVPLAILLGMAAVAVAVSERHRRQVLVGFSAQSGGRVGPSTFPLARVEVLRLVRHPLTVLGLVGTVAVSVSSWSDPLLGSRWLWLGYGLYPLLGGAVIASHLAVSRDDRAELDELAESLPVNATQRTVSHLLTAGMVTVPTAVAWYVVVGARLAWDWSAPLEGAGWSAVWEPGLVELVQPLLIVAVVLSIAVAAGRWWRHPIAAILVPLVLLVSPFMWAVPLMLEGGAHGHYETQAYIGETTDTHLAWHLVFLVSVLVLAVVGALLRHEHRRWMLALLGLALVALVTSFGLQNTVHPG